MLQKQKQNSRINESKSFNSQMHQVLTYYKDKVDQLSGQRLSWLSKFNQCKFKLNRKHQQQDRLRNLRNKEKGVHRDIVHHSVANLDQTINTIRADRQNLIHIFRDAEERMKIESVLMENSQIQKKIPCSSIDRTKKNIIHNDLNIHQRNGKKGLTNSNKRTSYSTLQTIQNSGIYKKKVQSPQDLLKQQIIEVKKLNDCQISALAQQAQNLQKQISNVKEYEKGKVEQQRKFINQINKKYKDLEKKHRQLAEEYFASRKIVKQRQQNAKKQNETLEGTFNTLSSKINQQLKVYEKENKAKQTLIVKKSQDFQQDYKAKMRAKQRNLAALKENYQKMQNIFIEKARKLQNTVSRAKALLQEAQGRRGYLVQQLRSQLKQLEQKNNEQRIQRIENQMKLKQKAERQQALKQEALLAETKKNKSQQKSRNILEAYKKTKSPAVKNNTKSKQKKNIQKKRQKEQSEDSQDSLEISDIQNIRKQINLLEQKICN